MCAALPLNPAAEPLGGSRAGAAADAATSELAATAAAAWDRRAMRLDDTGVVDPLSAHEGQDRLQPLELLVRDLGVVGAQDDEVGELSHLDRAEVVLHAHVPRVVARVEAHCLLAGDLLVDVDLLTEGVQAR